MRSINTARIIISVSNAAIQIIEFTTALILLTSTEHLSEMIKKTKSNLSIFRLLESILDHKAFMLKVSATMMFISQTISALNLNLNQTQDVPQSRQKTEWAPCWKFGAGAYTSD